MNNPVKFEAQKIKNFQKIKFKGKINNKNLIYLYGLSDNGEPGFNIIKEVDIEGENFLINQGWIPRDLKGNLRSSKGISAIFNVFQSAF